MTYRCQCQACAAAEKQRAILDEHYRRGNLIFRIDNAERAIRDRDDSDVVHIG